MRIFNQILFYFRIAFIVSIISVSIFFAYIISFFVRDRELLFQKLIRFWVAYGLKLSGAKIQVKGLENIPLKGPALLVSSHDPYLGDAEVPFFISVMDRKFYLTAGSSFFNFPLSVLTKNAGYLPLEITNTASTKNDLERICTKIQNGAIVFMFLYMNSELKPKEPLTADKPSLSPVFVAMSTGVPIIPISVRCDTGLGHIKRIYGKKETIPVRIAVGKLIDPSSIKNQDRNGRMQLAENVLNAIKSLDAD